MAISKSDSITVSEDVTLFLPLLPVLSQADLGIVSGNTYKLSFDAVITTGILKIYQGSQLIYTSGIVYVGAVNTLYDAINVTEYTVLERKSIISVFDSITVSENVSLSIPLPVNVFDSATITENITENVV